MRGRGRTRPGAGSPPLGPPPVAWRHARRAAAGVPIALALHLAPSAGASAQEASWLNRVSLDVPSVTHRLPGRLREISGLAVTADGRLFGHDDERGVVYEIDIEAGELLKGFGLGDPTVRADFEGIAAAHGRIYLVTSAGTIHETREGADDERMLFNTYGTGLGRRCEVEGLAYEPTRDALLLACKNPREEGLEGSVTIFFWSFESRELSDSPLRIDEAALAAAVGEDRFQPSGIERVGDTGTYLLLAGPQRALVEVSPTGSVVVGRSLDAERHRQAEGIAILPDGRLVIADEGEDRRARITVYAPHP